MSQSLYPAEPPAGRPRPAIVVEMSMKPLPPLMRMGGLRSTVRFRAPGSGAIRRLRMAPIAMMTRLLGR